MADEMLLVEQETAIANSGETFVAPEKVYYVTEEEIMQHVHEMEAEENEKEN